MANIGALFSTFNFIFSSIYKFYEKNFDNYKIVEKLLSPNDTLKNKNLNLIKFDKNNLSLTLIDKELNKEKDDSLNIDKSDENLVINEIESENENEKKIKEDKNKKFILPKLYFFDYYFNNIYCNCCKRIKKQEIINTCNNIVLKYTSIDSIIFYQMQLQNLLKDYKWNDNKLNNLENHYSIILLKNLII